MKFFLRKLIIMSFTVLSFLFISSLPSFAETFDTSFGVAQYIEVKDPNVKDGSIISLTDKGYILSNKAYDPNLVGVVSENPAVEFKIEGVGKYPLISQGNLFVNVSTLNGDIKKGDLITSSIVPGVGMKATESGYVIGIALEDFSSKNQNEVKRILVSFNARYVLGKNAPRGILDIFSLSALALYERPTVVFRYFLAGLLVLLSFIFGFLTFSRVAARAIESLGRNPMASRNIQIGLVLNVLIAITIILAGLAIAYLVLRL